MGVDAVIYLCPATPVTEDEVKRIAVRMQMALGEDGICHLELPSERGLGHHSLTLADDGKVGVHTFARYYGPSYSRGPAIKILNTIRFLRDAFPGCDLHYGGDCEDDIAAFTPEDEIAMWKHVTGADGYAYYSASPSRSEGTVVCDFCDVRTNAHTFYGREVTSSCPSCRRQWKTNGVTAVLLAGKP